MKIKNIELKHGLLLAPMAGVTDRAFRELCMSYGACYCVTEMVSSKGLTLNDKKSKELLSITETERPCGAQIFGNDPETMAKAAIKTLEFNPEFIDINMGCPAPKVAGNGGGSALMKDPVLAEKIVKKVVESVDLPITVKMRTGWDSDSLNAVELAKRCENAGASMITVHGRTRTQMYAPGIDFETIAEVKKSVKIPVVGNGDIRDGKSAKEMFDRTGCDLIMVGRAAQGNPFVFAEINAFLKGENYTPPTLEEKFKTLIRQIELMAVYKDEYIAVLESRKHTAWYMQGLNGAANLRRLCGEIKSFDDIKAICEKAIELNGNL